MERNYSLIVNELVGIQPQDWTRVVAYAQITEESYEIFFYSKVEDKYVKNFDLEKKYNLPRVDVRTCFKKVYEELLPDFKEKQWFVCTIQIERNGKFSFEYEYTDYSEDSINFKRLWKNKYLL